MALTVTVASTLTIAETLPTNTGSAVDAKRVVTHEAYNVARTLTATTTPPVTTQASFLLTLSGGLATIDLRELVGTNGASIDGNGLKVQELRIRNLGADPMTFYEGATDGHNLFSVNSGAGVGGQVVFASGFAHLETYDHGDDISATTKTIDVIGTGSQTAEITIVMG